jgi:6-phosphogluconolactonase
MIYIKNTAAETCTECAKSLIYILKNKIQEHNIAYIAISGGSTPKLLFDIICESFANDIEWEKVHIFWVDERCVPPDDNESNYKMTVEHLLSKLPFDKKKIHRIMGEFEPAIEIVRYAQEISDVVPFQNGLPAFDIILLGMGDDGHTASIFPNALHLLESSHITATAIHPQSGQVRVTLTGRVINNAEHVMFLVTGQSKAKVLDIILHNKSEALQYPAAHIAPIKKRLNWFVDKEAASN